VVLGIATLILGLAAIISPLFAGGLAAAIVAGLLIAAGITRLFYAFRAETFPTGALRFAFGGLSILAGAFMLLRPLLGLASLTLVLIAYLFADGVAHILGSFRLKGVKGWGWMLLSGFASAALAVLIWLQWPLSGAWAIGVLIGMNLVLAGWSMIAVGFIGELGAAEGGARAEPASE
jgi:uncharacterized membrane protein HdeD (DUF308 family)